MTALPDNVWDAICAAMAEIGSNVVLAGFYNLERLSVRSKSDIDDLVTDADEGAERALERDLSRLLPGAVFVGEEMVAREASALASIGQAEMAIIVDPIDGTWNFTNGMPLFGMMVAITYIMARPLPGRSIIPSRARRSAPAKAKAHFFICPVAGGNA